MLKRRVQILSWLGILLLALVLASAAFLGRQSVATPILAALLIAAGVMLARASRR